MKGTFGDRIKEFEKTLPERSVKGTVVVDQIYAHYQHEGLDFHHPDGGQAQYLREPLFLNAGQYLSHLARKAVTKDGSDLIDAMSDNMEDLSQEVYDRAPMEFADLKASGHPIVEVDGKPVYDRPPLVHRLSDDELRIKAELRYLFDPHRYKR